jgi:hypothetical protein
MNNMATSTTKRPKAAAAKNSPAAPPQEAPKMQETPMIGKLTLDQFVELTDSRVAESEGFYNGPDFNLRQAEKDNQKYYLGNQVSPDDIDKALDNRIFSAIRSILPYTTARVTEPEVAPSDNQKIAKAFAQDLEAALYKHVQKQKLRMKMKFAVQDAMIVRRGWLKLRYDAATGCFCFIEYCPAESIIPDHKAKPYEEPRYLRHKLDKTVEDLLVMFPENEAKIKETFHIDDTTSYSEYYRSHEVNEDWVYSAIEGKLDLFVVWSYRGQPLGMIQDPNWRYDDTNFLDYHQIPFIPITILSDGRTIIDKTSFVEQAKYSQDTIDERTRQISKNAGLGSIGMPVVDSRAMADDQAQFITYDPDTVLELDVESTEQDDIRKVFTTWKADTLPAQVFTDKQDARDAVDNAFGTSNLMRGQESENKTLGQDVLLRDQTEGRQSEVIDAIDAAMDRLYPMVAQMLLVYGNEEEMFRVNGEKAEFDYVIMHSADLDTEAEIGVKAGTSMPVDRPQLRATAKQAAADAMIDPRTYWEIMDEPNAEKYAKRLVEYTADPTALIKDISDDTFNRDAQVDIEIVIRGGQPPYREDLTTDYFDHLKNYAMGGALDPENPNLSMEVKQALVDFINAQLLRGQKMLGMAETQLPTAQEVSNYNTGVDAANQGDAAAIGAAAQGMPPQGPPAAGPNGQPGTETPPPQTPATPSTGVA